MLNLEMNGWLSVPRAAEVLDVAPCTVKRWLKAGLVTGNRTPGGRWRLRREDVEALLARG